MNFLLGQFQPFFSFREGSWAYFWKPWFGMSFFSKVFLLLVFNLWCSVFHHVGCDGCGMWPIRGMAYEVDWFLRRGFKPECRIVSLRHEQTEWFKTGCSCSCRIQKLHKFGKFDSTRHAGITPTTTCFPDQMLGNFTQCQLGIFGTKTSCCVVPYQLR